MTTTRTVIHPIFDECRGFTLDSFWQEQFSMFAANKFPMGVRYDSAHKNLILKLEGKRSEVIAIPDDRPTETFQIMMNVLKGRLNMRSTRDLQIERKALDDAVKKRTVELGCEWKKIKPRQIRDQLMMDFIGELKTYYSLTLVEYRKLVCAIQLAFQFKSLTPDDVVYDAEEGKVTDINGLVFDEQTREFQVPKCPAASTKTTERPSVSTKFYTTLVKYYKENNARVVRLTA